jgi:NitT/TauT family transport system permease protein
MPNVLTALRLTMGIGWLVVVAAEMLAVRSGLGYLILDSRNALRMDYVMVGMMMIGLLGIVLDELMRRLAHLHPSLQRPY